MASQKIPTTFRSAFTTAYLGTAARTAVVHSVARALNSNLGYVFPFALKNRRGQA